MSSKNAPFPGKESARWWIPRPNGKWICQACLENRELDKKNAIRHESTQKHRDAVAHHSQQPFQASTTSSSSSSKMVDATLPAMRTMLHDMAEECAPGSSSGEPEIVDEEPDALFDEAFNNSDTSFSGFNNTMKSHLAQSLTKFLDDDALSEEELAERSDGDIDDRKWSSDDEDNSSQRSGSKRAKSDKDGSAKEWYPWPDKLACTLDILMHLPRSVFSMRQLDLLRWLLNVNGVADVPSERSTKNVQALLQSMCGARTIAYDGAFGHKYYVNALADIIAQEMANPRVRPNLHFYPEDTGKTLNETWQASRWLNEVDASQLTPMAVIKNQHFFVHEPCLLASGSACMPFKWFTRGSALMAKAWPLRPVTSDSGSSWVVEQFRQIDVHQDEFLVAFGTWDASASTHGLPHVTSIRGVMTQPSGSISPWNLTDPSIGNRWRARANGARVYSFPLWLYCDDTSGNVSKKWNKHNSFLFTPAGLPRRCVHEEYNVHFLCTSNIAPPLEMLDGIVEQLETASEDGIWAWDHAHGTRVLVIPFVLALLGDNPMQSEFACHVGSMGKFFCRVCKVKGFDQARDPDTATTQGDSIHDGTGDAASGHTTEAEPMTDNAAGSDSGASTRGRPRTSRKKRRPETMAEMVDRVKRFLTIGELRGKDDTMDNLRSMFSSAKHVGTQTKIKDKKTATGIKDGYLDFFMERIFKSYKDKHTNIDKQEAIDACVPLLPADNTHLLSPVWRIKGLDPHLDTPVEILHTILLGFVKYFWRDVIHNQVKHIEEKHLLMVRLSSCNVEALGMDKLSGYTLVKYAGSLTGRDFRAIAQVAPFVLHDLVSKPCYDTWISLSNLIPLIWQPSIPDIDIHTTRVRAAIYHFLSCTARWTPRWFNKPKFHVILHLVSHIRRFGPASLFATEAFESFNAVIRAKSVHSNRHAPSRDIALAFAHGSRIRHMLSGGLFFVRSAQQTKSSTTATMTSQTCNGDQASGSGSVDHDISNAGNASMWHRVGQGPLVLMSRPNVVTNYLGLDTTDTSQYGCCTSDGSPARPYMQTQTGRAFPHALPGVPQAILEANFFQTSKSLVLLNGDHCAVGQWVLVRPPNDPLRPIVGKILEVLTRLDIPSGSQLRAGAILVQQGSIAGFAPNYNMPTVSLETDCLLVPLENLLCTANLQHRCQDYQCSPTGFEYIREEGQLTNKTREIIAHSNPTDLMLNTARMRDAMHMETLRFPLDPQRIDMDLDNAVLDGVRSEIDHRKALGNVAESSGTAQSSPGVPRGRGRGPSRVPSPNRGRGQARGRARGRGQGRGRGQAQSDSD